MQWPRPRCFVGESSFLPSFLPSRRDPAPPRPTPPPPRPIEIQKSRFRCASDPPSSMTNHPRNGRLVSTVINIIVRRECPVSTRGTTNSLTDINQAACSRRTTQRMLRAGHGTAVVSLQKTNNLSLFWRSTIIGSSDTKEKKHSTNAPVVVFLLITSTVSTTSYFLPCSPCVDVVGRLPAYPVPEPTPTPPPPVPLPPPVLNPSPIRMGAMCIL